MEEREIHQNMLLILSKVNSGYKDVDADDFNLTYDDYKEIIDLMVQLKLINGPDFFYDGLLDLSTAHITSRGRGFLMDNN